MAVADFSPIAVQGKLPSRPDGQSASELIVRLLPTAKSIDIVKTYAPNCHLLGFKLLADATDAQLVAAAKALAERSGADLVFANDISDYRLGHRRGLLVDGQGAIAARLDGGDAADATEQLALAISSQTLAYFRL